MRQSDSINREKASLPFIQLTVQESTFRNNTSASVAVMRRSRETPIVKVSGIKLPPLLPLRIARFLHRADHLRLLSCFIGCSDYVTARSMAEAHRRWPASITLLRPQARSHGVAGQTFAPSSLRCQKDCISLLSIKYPHEHQPYSIIVVHS